MKSYKMMMMWWICRKYWLINDLWWSVLLHQKIKVGLFTASIKLLKLVYYLYIKYELTHMLKYGVVLKKSVCYFDYSCLFSNSCIWWKQQNSDCRQYVCLIENLHCMKPYQLYQNIGLNIEKINQQIFLVIFNMFATVLLIV